MLAMTWGVLTSACGNGADDVNRQEIVTRMQTGVVTPPPLKRVSSPPIVVHPIPPEAVTALRTYLGAQRVPRTHYLARNIDLNGDGEPEAMVYLQGADHCSVEGCTLLVLQPEGSAYRVHSSSRPLQLPILASVDTHDGWRDLLAGRGHGAPSAASTRLVHADGHYPDDPPLATAHDGDIDTSRAEILITPPKPGTSPTPLGGQLR